MLSQQSFPADSTATSRIRWQSMLFAIASADFPARPLELFLLCSHEDKIPFIEAAVLRGGGPTALYGSPV
jgi:hypothetical protein